MTRLFPLLGALAVATACSSDDPRGRPGDVDPCLPAVCTPADCGEIDDGCGGTLECAECTSTDCMAGSEMPGSIFVHTQADVEKLRGYEKLEGALSFAAEEELDLSPLDCLREAGELTFHEGLPVAGLDKLVSAGEVRLFQVPQTELSLASLRVTDSLSISSGRTLERVAMPALREIGQLHVYDEERLASLELPMLETVGLIVIHEVKRLADVVAPRLGVISGNVFLQDLPALEEISFLGDVTEIGGYLHISQTGVRSLTPLEGVTRVGNGDNPDSLGAIEISFNPSLKTLSGLGGITALSILDITGNTTLRDVEGLNNVRQVRGSIRIDSNPSLVDVEGLRNLETNELQVMISGNDALTTLAGLRRMRRADWFYIRSNDALADVDALLNLTTTGSSLVIENNPALSQCDAQTVASHWADVFVFETSPLQMFVSGNGPCD